MNNLKVTALIALLFLFCSAAEKTLNIFVWEVGAICAFAIPTIAGLIVYWIVGFSFKEAYDAGVNDGKRNAEYYLRSTVKEELYRHERQYEHTIRQDIKSPIQS